MKKILSVLLAVIVIASTMSILTVTASAATVYNPKAVVSYSEKYLNSSWKSNSCLNFVATMFKNAYGTSYSSARCAYEYGSKFIDSTSDSNIPIGADVFFYGGNCICKNGGHKCGHIGIYVGDGYIIHAWSGRVIKSKISDVVNTKRYTYLGWGWHGNMSFSTTPTKSDIKFSSFITLSTLTYGKTFSTKAVVKSSSYRIYSVTGGIYNSNGSSKIYEKTVYPNSFSYNVAGSAIDNALLFNKLPVGTFIYRIVACDTSGKTISRSCKFTVKNSNTSVTNNSTKAASTLTINLTQAPTSVSYGKCFGLRGTVTSNYSITSVNGYIIDSNGKTVQSTADNPNAKSLDIRYANLNNNLLFNKLPRGTYRLRIVATDTSGTSRAITRSFNVK